MERLTTLSKELDDLLQELHPSPSPPVLEKMSRASHLKTSRDLLKTSLKKLMEDVETFTAKRDVLKNENNFKKAKVAQLSKRLDSFSTQLEKESVVVRQSSILWEDTCRLLDVSRSRLALDLSRIFPITQCPSNSSVLCIRGNPLPSSLSNVSDPLTGVFPPNRCFSLPLNSMCIFGCWSEFKERQTSVALGDAAQLVLILSEYLNVMLPYPVKLMGSFTQIIDPLSCPETEEVCRYSLYPIDTSIMEFSQALTLLNCNIRKLLESQNLSPLDLENTLANLDWLLKELISKPTCSIDLTNNSI